MNKKIIVTAAVLFFGSALAESSSDGLAVSERRWEGYVPGCVAAGTMVNLASGERVTIETVNENQLVATADGAMAVLKKSNNVPSVKMYMLVDSSGNSLVATAHHPVFTKEFGFIKLSDVKPGNTLKTVNGETKVVSNTITQYEGNVYNILISENASADSFYGSNILIGGAKMQELLDK